MSIFSKNLASKDISIFGLLVLIGALVAVNYIAIKSGLTAGSMPLVVFAAFLVILFIINPLYTFVYALVLHVDVMTCFNYSWAKSLTFVCMFLVFIVDFRALFTIFRDRKLKILFNLALLFSLYLILVNFGYKSGLNSGDILKNFGFVFGFLAIIPAYYLTTRHPKILFASITAVAAAFVFVYFLDLQRGMDLFKLANMERNTGANIERLAGYDVRQFVLFYAYLIPATVVATNVKNVYKIIMAGIGIAAYVILILAFYRLAMFYVAMGGIFSFILIRRYAPTGNFIKYIFYGLLLFFVASYFFGDYLKEISNLFEATINYFQGKAEDGSADARFNYQFPVLMKMIDANAWTGIGLVNIKSMTELGMFGFVDFPVLGTVAAYGVVGMAIYYLRYLILLSGIRNHPDNIHNFINNESPLMFYIYLTLKAYLITMVTFRMFYISWEITFDYLQTEFGVFAGAFIALDRMIKDSYDQTEDLDDDD